MRRVLVSEPAAEFARSRGLEACPVGDAAAAQARRRQENAARRAAGEPLLPEEDEAGAAKAPPEPSPLDGYLVTSQIAGYCERLGAGASGTLRKLAMLEGLERAGGAAAVSGGAER
mgnify:CR=1 FL=1